MSSHANSEFKERSSLGMEWGVAIGLAFLLVLFELVPASELGRLSTRTSDSEMEAVEADMAFDDTVEEQEEEIEEEQEELEEEAEDVLEEIREEVTLSLSEDETGLEQVETVTTSEGFDEAGSGADISTPSFTPVEVYPNCTYRPMPEYPDLARQAGVEGSVVLWVYVNADGTVGNVVLYNGSGVGSLDQAAMDAAWLTRWSPAMNNGIPVTCWTTVTYNFRLQD
ncbi:energy transducer TonB [Candidatus Fermentibacterales bacterium]|nr:energy transducer TonB [Candidatus Fermentibacterales bacterium]